MNIGVVSIWCNRGQATVARQIRELFDGLGHKTHVLARPVRTKAATVPILDTDVWMQEGVTHASTYLIPLEEYLAWARDNAIEVAFFDQNYQFEEIAALRSHGVRTIGRFVWEKFSADCVAGALEAFDVIYSLTSGEQQRYRSMGIQSPKVEWGCHPEVISRTAGRPDGEVRILFPASGRRKPVAAALEAFGRAKLPDNVTLILKSQENRTGIKTGEYDVDSDPRIQWENRDLDFDEYHQLFAASHLCYCPSRWEGLGLHLYEAIGHGVAVITNDIPPMNEIIRDGQNGLLVQSHRSGFTPSGVPAYDPDPDDLVRALEEATSPDRLERLMAGARRRRDEMPWRNTVDSFKQLLDQGLAPA